MPEFISCTGSIDWGSNSPLIEAAGMGICGQLAPLFLGILLFTIFFFFFFGYCFATQRILALLPTVGREDFPLII